MKQGLPFDQALGISPSPRRKQSKNRPAELILLALLEFSNRLSHFLEAPIGFEEKRQLTLT